MYIEIDTHDHLLDFELFEIREKTTFSVGDQKSLPGGFTMIFDGVTVRKAIGFPETITLVITFAGTVVSSVAINLLSSWLYDKLKGRAETLRIDRREIHIDKGEITRIIEESIRQER